MKNVQLTVFSHAAWLWRAALFWSFSHLKCFYNISHPYCKEPTSSSETHSHTNGTAIRSNVGFSILPKGTSTRRREEPGIKLHTVWLVDGLLYLSYRRLKSHRLVPQPTLVQTEISQLLDGLNTFLGSAGANSSWCEVGYAVYRRSWWFNQRRLNNCERKHALQL